MWGLLLVAHSAHGWHCHNGQLRGLIQSLISSLRLDMEAFVSLGFYFAAQSLSFSEYCIVCMSPSCSIGKEISKHLVMTLGLHKLPRQVLPVALTTFRIFIKWLHINISPCLFSNSTTFADVLLLPYCRRPPSV